MIRPACFTDDEWHHWTIPSPYYPLPQSACLDCPLWFARDMRAEGCCDGEPGYSTRGLPSEDPAVLARRTQWREAQRRKTLARRLRAGVQ